MGFLMDGLDSEAYDRTYSDRVLVKRIVDYFRPEIGKMSLVALAIFSGSVLETLLPIGLSKIIDLVGSGPNIAPVQLMLLWAGAVIAVGSLSWVFNLVRGSLSAVAVGNVVLKLREDAFDAVLARDLSFYDQFASGKIVSRVTSDTQSFAQVVTLVIDLLSRILQVFILVGYLFTVNVPLTFMMLALAPFIIGAALAFRNLARNTVTQSRRMNAVVSAHVQETISGIGVAKTFRQEGAIYEEFKDYNRKSFWINLKTGFTFSGIFPILNILAGVGTGALVYFGGLRALSGEISAGSWFLFIQGLNIFWFPLTSIASFWSQFQLGLAAAERVYALIDTEPKVIQTGDEKLGQIKGEIRFDHVEFRYKDDEPVLHDYSLTIAAGETLALVGHTGAGKSSIAKLIARFYEFQGGKITVDGHDIRALDLASYRSKVGIVNQSPFLFDGTVLDNIRYAKQGATDAEVEAAARGVGGGDWIASLPDGLNTQVGERGGGLSMGQRQLVALARVLIQAPAIFILDEATASVDPLTEALIQEGLDAVLVGRTSVVIAHRLSTIKNADRIIVMRQGKIIEEGSHDSLLKQGGHYAELYTTYFRHQSLEYIEEAGAAV